MLHKDKLVFLLDRTAVLFLGLIAGAITTFSFYAPVEPTEARSVAPVQAAAQAAPAPAQPPSIGLNLVAAAAQGRTIHVAVFGDSFGDGIWWALQQHLRKDASVEVHRFSRPSSGLANHRSAAVLEDIRTKLDREPADIAVVSFGANDAIGIYSGGVAAEFMSAEWQRIVGERVDTLVAMLRERGAAVYWVGLPRMRSPQFDANIQKMNAFYTERMRLLNVPFIDTAPLSVDGQGRYAPYLPDRKTGRPAMMRANDGIHMTMIGYTVLTEGLFKRIRTSIDDARSLAVRIEARHAAGPRDRRAGSRG